MKVKPEDFKIGQIIGVLWRSRNNESTTYRFEQAKITKLTQTKNNLTILTKPKLFTIPLRTNDEFVEDYRTLNKDGFVTVDTPMLLSEETAEYFSKLADKWNITPPKSVWDD
jgi:hypothetical protein